jgi:4-amino-4-deoxy-L-arabinose transferase-like glycosyltransferase
VSAVTAHCSATGNSNQIWPIFLANQNGYLDAPQFLHATSLTKVLGVFGCRISAYSGWFWANLFAVAVTSFLTFHCVRSLTNRTVTAQVAFLACLASPASFWLMTQPLLETALSGLLTCAVAALVFLRRLDVAV